MNLTSVLTLTGCYFRQSWRTPIYIVFISPCRLKSAPEKGVTITIVNYFPTNRNRKIVLLKVKGNKLYKASY